MELSKRIERAAQRVSSHPNAALLDASAMWIDRADYHDFGQWDVYYNSERSDVTDWQLGQCSMLADAIVLNDHELRRGFEGDALHDKFDGQPLVLVGATGQAFDSRTMFTSALDAAIQRRFLAREPLDASSLEESLRWGVDELRSAIETGKTTATVVCGLDRVTVHSPLETPWGTVLPVRSTDDHAFDRPRCTSLWLRQREVEVRIVANDSLESPHLRIEEEDQRVFDLLRLAFVIADEDFTEMQAPNRIWYREQLPFATLGTVRRGFVEPCSFDRVVAPASVADWAAQIGDGRTAAIRLASKRLPLATSRDVEDSLIDAVVVWEAVFGAKTETTFRVTASLAKLLEPDSAKRQLLASGLKKTYGIRSRIVHGGESGDVDLYEHRARAVRIATAALRASLLRGSDWMELTSEQRGERILLE